KNLTLGILCLCIISCTKKSNNLFSDILHNTSKTTTLLTQRWMRDSDTTEYFIICGDSISGAQYMPYAPTFYYAVQVAPETYVFPLTGGTGILHYYHYSAPGYPDSLAYTNAYYG